LLIKKNTILVDPYRSISLCNPTSPTGWPQEAREPRHELKVIQDAGDKGLMILIRCRPAIGNSVENPKKMGDLQDPIEDGGTDIPYIFGRKCLRPKFQGISPQNMALYGTVLHIKGS